MNLSVNKTGENLNRVDYLIYSSHKTRTQTLNHTFHLNGIKSRPGHYFPHFNLEEQDLGSLPNVIFCTTGGN